MVLVQLLQHRPPQVEEDCLQSAGRAVGDAATCCAREGWDRPPQVEEDCLQDGWGTVSSEEEEGQLVLLLVLQQGKEHSRQRQGVGGVQFVLLLGDPVCSEHEGQLMLLLLVAQQVKGELSVVSRLGSW